MSTAPATQPIFYYDLGDPECYVVAEQIMSTLGVAPEWEPVWLPDLREPRPDRERIERLAAAQELQPVRWPEVCPVDSRTAMLTATYAKQIGRAVAFSLAAFRQAFAGGRDLSDRNTVLIAAAACEMHPTAVLKALSLRSTGQALAQAGARAASAGIRRLPAIQVGASVCDGPGCLSEAASTLATPR